MKDSISISLAVSPEQAERLAGLQRVFAELCNSLTPLVQSTRCWNRVALHHLAYRSLRLRFPDAGSQIVCNAIYSVSRAYRLVVQYLAKLRDGSGAPAKALPLLRFRDDAPVFFDWHTVSIKGGVLSLYTLEGRMKFHVDLAPEVVGQLSCRKIREIVLASQGPGAYRLTFVFSDKTSDGEEGADVRRAAIRLPKYLILDPVRGEGVPALIGDDNDDQGDSTMVSARHELFN
jgi:hypothetical protein